MTEELVLPEKVIEASTKSPETLIIFSAPKAGKTSLAAQLENNLIIDLEKGSNHVSALKIKVNSCDELYAACEKIKEKEKPYRYITLDTATALEDMCGELALKLYQQTPMGKGYTGDVLSLPNGAGYKYIRDAFKLMINITKDSCERLILLGHVKDKTIEKGGKELSVRELDLVGKLSGITCAHADAIGFLYREKDTCVLTFKTENQLTCGARPVHLRNKDIVVSEMIDGELVTHWDKIFID